jgi:putative peptidoglycan lipid II flippase
MTSKTGLTLAFSRVASGTFLSRVLGLVREQVFAHLFGASLAADAFFAAYRIPNLLRDLFAEGALSSAFIPVFKTELQRAGKNAAFELAQVCFGVLTVILAVVVLAGMSLSPYIVKLIAPGFGSVPGKAALTSQLTVVMFPFLLLVALAALAMSILNSFDRFGIPALAPALFNVGVIAAAYLICPRLETPIFGMAIGVLLGGLGQLLIQLPGLIRIGLRLRFKVDFFHPGLRAIGRLMTPMIGGLAASRINIFVNTLLASLLTAGAVSYLTYSYRLMHLPLGMIAVALGTVALPKASAQAAARDSAGMTETFYRAIHLCFFLVFPVAAFFIACGDEVIALLFQHGRFVAGDTYNSYQALIWYSLGLIGFAGVRVTAPIYFAVKDAMTPMRFSVSAVIVNLIANFVFIPFMGFAGLAAATALGGLVNFALLVVSLPHRVPEIKRAPVLFLFARSALAAALVGLLLHLVTAGAWFQALETDLWGRIIRILILGGIALPGYLLVAFALNIMPSLRDFKKK